MTKNIVLIHGLWMTPRSWEGWAAHFTAKGYNVVTPAYPGFEVEVEALRADPSPIAKLTVPEAITHLESVINSLDTPPILMGHSAGGLLTQLLLDRGNGVAGVVVDSAPTEGVLSVPLSQIKSIFSILANPANRHRAVGFTHEQFHYAFTNSLSEEESQKVYDRYHIPAPGSWVWLGATASLTPGHQDTHVNYGNNDRAPLLFIAGGKDNIMPAAVNKANFKKYAKSSALTEYKEFPERTHYTVGQEGWEEVADYALAWALEHAVTPKVAAAV